MVDYYHYYFVEWFKCFRLYFVLICEHCRESTSGLFYCMAYVSNGGTAVSGRCLDYYYVLVDKNASKGGKEVEVFFVWLRNGW